MSSVSQFVHEVISGSVRRNTFTPWELELLLDLQASRVRKGSRPEVLKRYLRAAQQDAAHGSSDLLRLSAFLARENEQSRNTDKG